MSLDYNIGNIADRATKFPPDEHGLMHDDLHILIWATIQTGIGQITESNYAEFSWRIDYANRLGFALYSRIVEDGPPVPIGFSPERIRDAIGLSTNASPKTRNQFVKEISARFFDYAERAHARNIETAHKEEATS